MNNLLSYCGLVHVRINTSDKDLPVLVVAMTTPLVALIAVIVSLELWLVLKLNALPKDYTCE